MSDERKETLVTEIIERELVMFQSVKSREPSLCQERPESFRLMRRMTHSVLSEKFLESYLDDLKKAEEKGRNLMTEKYGLMEGSIPLINLDERVREIVAAEGAWRREVAAVFPRTVLPDGHQSFCAYLRGELMTYSGSSLHAYLECVHEAKAAGRNLVRERYDHLMQMLGHGSLEEYEAGLSAA